jgi:hypothetical protein
MFTNILKEPAASIFSVEKAAMYGKQWYRQRERNGWDGCVFGLFSVHAEEKSE